jgi:hypothetical protein
MKPPHALDLLKKELLDSPDSRFLFLNFESDFPSEEKIVETANLANRANH